MMRHGDPLPIRIYRRALVILPRRFRRDRGPAMVAMLADEWRDLRGIKRVLACLVPARRALRVEPVQALAADG